MAAAEQARAERLFSTWLEDGASPGIRRFAARSFRDDLAEAFFAAWTMRDARERRIVKALEEIARAEGDASASERPDYKTALCCAAAAAQRALMDLGPPRGAPAPEPLEAKLRPRVADVAAKSADPALGPPPGNVVELDVHAEEIRRGKTNVATTCAACIEISRRGATRLLSHAEKTGQRLPTEGVVDLVRTIELLDALLERAQSGKVVDLEALGIWEDLQG